MRRQFVSGVLLALVLVLAGCNPSKTNREASISGKVMYKGAPVTGGTLTIFIGEVTYPVGIGSDGSYNAVQLPAGEAVATVNNDALNPDKPKYGDKMAKIGPMPKDRAQVPTGTYVKIPAKYKDKKTSDLKVTLVAGKNDHTFELKD
jgi:hypothetical protein